jgi:hypothetical protein
MEISTFKDYFAFNFIFYAMASTMTEYISTYRFDIVVFNRYFIFKKFASLNPAKT